MIQIRGLYTDWVEVSRNKAKDYIEKIEVGMLCNAREREKHINKKRLRGITYEELMK